MAKGAPDYTRLAHIFGVTAAGELVQVRVDDDGNIVAIMTGEYSGSSKTLATDEDGRILAIITDPENIWGIRPIVGNAELAVRLGSPTQYDRRGSVMNFEGFETGLHRVYLYQVTGTGSIILTTDYVRSGGYATKLTTIKTGDYSTGFYQYFHFPSAETTLAHEFHVSFLDDVGAVSAKMTVYTGSRVCNAGIQWVLADGKVYYWGSGGSWVDSGYTMSAYHTFGFGYLWHNLKFVFNPFTEKYMRILVNHLNIDLSAVSIQAVNETADPELVIGTMAIGDATDSYTYYFDDFIFTVREPD